MKYIALDSLLARLEEMKKAYPEFSPLLDTLAKEAEQMEPSISVYGNTISMSSAPRFREFQPGMKGEPGKYVDHYVNPPKNDNL